MVFALQMSLLSVSIFLTISTIDTISSSGSKLSLESFTKVLIQSIMCERYNNFIFATIFFYIWLSGNTFLIIGYTLFLWLLTSQQRYIWRLWLEEQFLGAPLSVKPLWDVLSQKLSMPVWRSDWKTICRRFIRSHRAQFKELIRLTKKDIQVAVIFFSFVDHTASLTEAQREVYEYNLKYFDVEPGDEYLEKLKAKTDKEVKFMFDMLQKFKIIRMQLTRHRRLSLTFKVIWEDEVFRRFFTRNGIVVYNFFKTTLVSVALMCLYFLYSIFFFKVQFLKQLAVWFIVGMLYFWLMSGFNFFLKRYQYGKFTSQIQRFWKRTNTYFWLIEGFLLLLFFYYYLNSSQEPLYMYDYSALNQEYLIPLHSIGLNVILLSLVIYFMYFTMLRINSNSWTQINLYLLIISVFIFFSFFVETYQFYYVISIFNERVWIFNEEENIWAVDTDNPILRTKHHYLLVCLIAKYWHFLFIFLSWVFFLLKSFERKKVTFALFGVNLQNMIILYVLNFACYVQWFKWLYRRFLDLPYTWFFTSIDNKLTFRLFFEIKLLLVNLVNFNLKSYSYSTLVYKSLTTWGVDSLFLWKFI